MKILSSEDAYDKAADCYISSQSGGMFGTDSRKLLEKKKKKKWYTVEDDRDIAGQLAQMEADRNETDNRLASRRQSAAYDYSSGCTSSYARSSDRDQRSSIAKVERQFARLEMGRPQAAICYDNRRTNQRAIEY
uniref:Uncharacterized protein n=1 Tax=Plectus sambesii TaxID=2011161 RepID=A0A914UP00_9BILA